MFRSELEGGVIGGRQVFHSRAELKMIKRVMMTSVLALGVSACSTSERWMDAAVRPTDHADCLVGNDPLLDRDQAVKNGRSGGVRSIRAERCQPGQGL